VPALPAPEWELSYFTEIGEVEPLRIWDGLVGWSVTGDEAALTAIEIEPGVVVPEHQHPNEQTGILLKGSLTFRIGEETRELRPGSMWVIPGATPHTVTAGDDGAFLVELFAPPRTDWGDLPRLSPRTPNSL
jgi:quercetin dioxygenase-like cupin family protein